MKNTFEKRIVENAESARLALTTFLQTPGTLSDGLSVSHDLIYSCSEAVKKLDLFIELRKSAPEVSSEDEEETRQDPPARSLEGRILRDIRNGKEVTIDGDPERRKAFTFLTRNGFIQNVGSRRYPIYEAIDAE